jgi:hypothetical protein
MGRRTNNNKNTSLWSYDEQGVLLQHSTFTKTETEAMFEAIVDRHPGLKLFKLNDYEGVQDEALKEMRDGKYICTVVHVYNGDKVVIPLLAISRGITGAIIIRAQQ